MDANNPRRQWSDDALLVRRVLIIGGILVLALMLWTVLDVFLLAFAAVLMAVLLRFLAGFLERRCWIPKGWSLVLSGLIVLLVVGSALGLLGAQVVGQLQDLAGRLTGIVSSLEQRFGMPEASERAVEQVRNLMSSGGLFRGVAGFAFALLGTLANIALVIFGAAYLAASPTLYRRGIVKLLPVHQHRRAEETLDATGHALQLWLAGQLAAMVIVAVLTTAGLWLIGVPSFLALGFVAGLTNFVPFVGPVVAALPALLVASAEGGGKVLWTLALYLAVQQLEGNFITPMIQRRAVDMPPALMLFAIVAFGLLFGTIGVILGAPLTVVAFVAVKKLYVRETLGEHTAVPGEQS